MKILSPPPYFAVFFSLVLNPSTCSARITEFGRPVPHTRLLKRNNGVAAKKRSAAILDRDDADAETFQSLVIDWEFQEDDLAMSLSMDYSDDDPSETTSPELTSQPSFSETTFSPTATASQSSSEPTPLPSTEEEFPSAAPTSVQFPPRNNETAFPSTTPTTMLPTMAPTQSTLTTTTASPSAAPSSPPDITTMAPTEDLFSDALTFACGADDRAITNSTTPIRMSVTYVAESTPGVPFIKDLGEEIFRTAVLAILNCPPEGVIVSGFSDNRILQDSSFPVGESASTIFLADCSPELENTTCFLLETQMGFFIDDPVNVEVATYNGYTAIMENMENDVYVDSVAPVQRVEYLSPFPVLPPASLLTQSPNAGSTLDTGSGVSVWTVSTCVVAIVGGVTALAVWARNRKRRQDRHVELLEDISMHEESAAQA